MATNATGRKLIKLTKADQNIVSGPPNALLVGTAGTVNLQDLDGNNCVNVPLQQGYNPIGIRQLQTGGTSTADDIWGIYN